ncbi:TetR family transcriptional regulator [Bacillus mangrovi]|uniref:TetR family transcriptional regulator n=1 Tax=Metabacillus mangrovi TaxID=1491830 RepID=A0A7X2V5B3_9BACI|nr:TetR/AcrR family transcriptional regulator [Metabacillus mangrovi]MTH53984.1 TetR family transcriptional regulator [Metabacillus mangrovi]
MATADMGDTRKNIIKAAEALFMEYGYRAISTRKIADTCGLTQPALYHHFPNKKSLYVEVVRNYLIEMKSALNRLLKRYTSLKESLYHVIRYILLHQPKKMTQMFHDIEYEITQEEQFMIAQCWREAYQIPINTIFERAAEEGTVKDPVDYNTTVETYSHLLMSMLSHPLPGSEKLLDQRAELYTEVILNGLSS